MRTRVHTLVVLGDDKRRTAPRCRYPNQGTGCHRGVASTVLRRLITIAAQRDRKEQDPHHKPREPPGPRARQGGEVESTANWDQSKSPPAREETSHEGSDHEDQGDDGAQRDDKAADRMRARRGAAASSGILRALTLGRVNARLAGG